MPAPGRYIFCDIDGTLLRAKGSGRIAFARAFLEAYGVPVDMSHINFSGATDLRVVEQLIREKDLLPDSVKTGHFFDLLAVYLD